MSLGINLMPADGKICTFNCIYCECGFNEDHQPQLPRPTREEVAQALEQRLISMHHDGPTPDVLTFAGNGEPTCHPHFAEIIGDTLELRNRYFPRAKVSVLTNATRIHLPQVHAALMKVDNNICKLDTISPDYIQQVDRPNGHSYNVASIIEGLKAFNGHVIIQTMFMKGYTQQNATRRQVNIDNTGEAYVAPWIEALKAIRPMQVMIYTIDRETPDHYLLKASHEELDAICRRVKATGIDCTASY